MKLVDNRQIWFLRWLENQCCQNLQLWSLHYHKLFTSQVFKSKCLKKKYLLLFTWFRNSQSWQHWCLAAYISKEIVKAQFVKLQVVNVSQKNFFEEILESQLNFLGRMFVLRTTTRRSDLKKNLWLSFGVIRSIGHKRRKYFLSGLSKCKPFVVPT